MTSATIDGPAVAVRNDSGAAFNVRSVPDAAARGPRDRVIGALIRLQSTVECAVVLVTVRHKPDGVDRVLFNYQMAPEHVQHGLDYFIPHSPDFRLVSDEPHEVLDWSRMPAFRETATAKDFLLASGFTQGVSFLLVDDETPVGTMHLNVTYTDTFGAPELQALDEARTTIQREVGAIVRAGDLGLSRRELEVLNLMSWGATNTEISEMLNLSRSTIRTHVEKILAKLKVANRVQAVRVALGLSLVDTA
ncbi:helix-turn-helix transcriptional regulator [Humibacter ginsengisoli]